MNSAMMYGAKAYATVGLETEVASASPHELILLLYDGVLKCIRNARQSLATGDIKAKCDHVSKAIRIMDEGLKSSVDTRVGGDLPDQLLSLYDYVSRELLLGSLRNEDTHFAACEAVLQELRDAWASISDRPKSSPLRTNTANPYAVAG